MIEVKAPDKYSDIKNLPSIFLGGSIEMGKAENWQERVSAALRHVDVLLLNPRRAHWDASWEQSIDNPPFREQVEWELDALDHADHIFMYFAPETKSPITLLELGLYAAKSPQKLVVTCPQGFWRKGNVDIVCNRHNVRQFDGINEYINYIVPLLKKGG